MSIKFYSCLVLLSIALLGCSSGEPTPTPQRRTEQQSASISTTSLPVVRESRFQNAATDCRYVGSATCAECHEDESNSYRLTKHSRALADIDIQAEPHDAEFLHAVSGKSYRVYRQDSQLRHREFVVDEDGSELIIADHPMRYVIGSGNHSRSYLVEIDGFLFESPVTWYTSKQAWGMSPGYAQDPRQPGFARPVQFACVTCHAGQVSPIDGSLHRLRIEEHAVGCERCHGAGSPHVARHRSDTLGDSEFDNTIVNPIRLSRSMQEAICAQCHLATDVQVNVRGRSIADFRPGLHLADFQVNYTMESANESMTVVGHVEQMRASRCYQESESLTCTTCHELHSSSSANERAAHVRQQCLNCHTAESCGLDVAQRVARSSDDNCVTCHMPQAPTDIPHFAFTHHRIAVPTSEEPPVTSRAEGGQLVSLESLEHLSEIDRQRCLGLAYRQLVERRKTTVKMAPHYDHLAAQLLEQVRDQGLQDAEVDAGLAAIYRRAGNYQAAIERAQSSLSLNPPLAVTECDALESLSRILYDLGPQDTARPLLERLSQIRYNAEDQLLLSEYRHRAGDLPGALAAAQRATAIEPDRPDLHRVLAELYLRVGQRDQSSFHNERGSKLQRLLRGAIGDEPASGE